MERIDNPAFDYENSGRDYSTFRQTDERIANYIYEELSGAKTILNVGAGAGSYEPPNKYIVAVEPSKAMRNRRLHMEKVPAINAKAESLPFDDNSFDASMATITIHHWSDISKGLTELRRVTKGPVIILTFDPDDLEIYWTSEYFQELIAIEKARFPTIEYIMNNLGGLCREITIPVPLDCKDGFQEAFYGRPEAFLDKQVRQSQSAWGFISKNSEDMIVQRLRKDLETGEWDKKYGFYRKQRFLNCALRMIVSSK